jgi:error-prone DNA polymerase
MSNQPCGFYPPQSLAAEARRQGIVVRPVEINQSALRCELEDDEGSDAIRLGFCLVNGMREDDVAAILAARDAGAFRSLLDFCRRVVLRRDSIESLVLCGAFERLHEHRRGLLWRLDETVAKAQALRSRSCDAGKTLDVRFAGEDDTPVAWEIDDLSDWQKLMWEWRTTGVTSTCHPFAHLREWLQGKGIISAYDAMQQEAGTRVAVAGLNIRPHRPPSKEGGRHLFTTLEDETAYLQVSFGGFADDCIATVLLSPVIVLHGTVRHRRYGRYLLAEKASPLRLPPDSVTDSAHSMLTAPPQRLSAAR